MNQKRMLNVIIASPGDIVIERKIVSEVCLGLNEGELLNHLGVSIRTAMWEDMFPADERPQAIINRLVDDCDILICILYRRFDAHSGWFESETLNGFLSLYDSWKALKKPHLMFFFKEIKPSDTNVINYPQLDEVHELKEKIEKGKDLYVDEFSAPYEFCEKVYDHIEKWVRENSNKH